MLAAALSLVLGSCFLLPEEARMPELPAVTPYDGSDFRYTRVIRGDMELKKTIQCTYQATKEAKYGFSVSGERFGDIFVEVGDRISAGMLLAEMDVSDINRQIDECENTIRMLEIKLAEAQKAYELAVLSESLTGSGTAMSDAHLDFISYTKQSLEIQHSRLSELEEKKKSRQLFADIDGVVTYVKSISERSTTVRGENIVTITDDMSRVFVADTESYKSFPEGLEVDILSEGVTYRCKVTSPDKLGIEEIGNQKRSQWLQRVYFVVLDAQTPEKNNARGEITLIEDKREDVLMLSTAAVFEADGRSMVYVQGDDGSITPKEIETGLRTTGYTEVLRGLDEGDYVIIS
jgi:multidrug efflux pump subunit AcrA (membrane-fusion protein)